LFKDSNNYIKLLYNLQEKLQLISNMKLKPFFGNQILKNKII